MNRNMMLAAFVAKAAGGDSGGNAGGSCVYSGSVVFESDEPTQNLRLNLGLPSRAKFFLMWNDKEEFLSNETLSNNYLNFVIMLPIGFNEFLPSQRGTNTLNENEYDRIFIVSPNVIANSASPNGYAISGAGTIQSGAYGEWLANDDGTITLNKWGSGSSRVRAGKYNWVAAC